MKGFINTAFHPLQLVWAFDGGPCLLRCTLCGPSPVAATSVAVGQVTDYKTGPRNQPLSTCYENPSPMLEKKKAFLVH